MIRLQFPPKPTELTEDIERQLIAEFIASEFKASVWDESFIKDPLRQMTNKKCAYCERQLGEGVNFTLDHYVHKAHAPNRVVEWGNLLPACQSCNSNKGTYNVEQDPFLNPTRDEPKDHIEISIAGTFRGITEQGRMVVSRLKLNTSDQKAPPRFRLIQAIHELTLKCEEYCDQLDQANNSRVRTRLRNKVDALLSLAQRKSEYAATAATILLNDAEFVRAVQTLQRLDDWSGESQRMLTEANTISLRLRLPVQQS